MGKNRDRLNRAFFVGCDLGRQQDFTAVCVLERFELAGDVWDDRRGGLLTTTHFELRHLARPALGTSYPAIAELLKS